MCFHDVNNGGSAVRADSLRTTPHHTRYTPR